MGIKEMTAYRAEVMLAFTKGRAIQERILCTSEWADCDNPSWDWFHNDYRIKFASLRYRLAIFGNLSGNTWVAVADSALTAASLEKCKGFLRWVGDWQEVGV